MECEVMKKKKKKKKRWQKKESIMGGFILYGYSLESPFFPKKYKNKRKKENKWENSKINV